MSHILSHIKVVEKTGFLAVEKILILKNGNAGIQVMKKVVVIYFVSYCRLYRLAFRILCRVNNLGKAGKKA